MIENPILPSFKPYIDAEGGEWITFESGPFTGTHWRPIDMVVKDKGRLEYGIEVIGNLPVNTEEFSHEVNKVMAYLLKEAADKTPEDFENNSI